MTNPLCCCIPTHCGTFVCPCPTGHQPSGPPPAPAPGLEAEMPAGGESPTFGGPLFESLVAGS